MGNLNGIKKILILVIIMALPGFLYYLLVTKGKNRYHPLAKFGPKTLAGTSHKVHGKDIPDTIFHTLGDFNLKDQTGQNVTLKSFDNKIFVANFFYTHCPGVCTTINDNVDRLVKNYATNKLIYFASITVDPERDSEKVLNAYAKKIDPASPKWMFLTGDTTTIYNLARKGFLVNALKAGKDDFFYSDKLILIDSHKRIRGYYSGASITEIVKLNDEIKVLISEELLSREKALY